MRTQGVDIPWPTPTEIYDPSLPVTAPDGAPPPDGYPGLRPGPYPAGTRPDQVFFRTGAPVDPQVRQQYESAQTPRDTDALNADHLLTQREPHSPLGDPVPFSAYLIGRLANPTGYDTQFNLDSDRAFAYLTWDWIRGDTVSHTDTGFAFDKPNVAPQGEMQDGSSASEWDATGSSRLELHYVDAPAPPRTRPRQRARRPRPAPQPEAPR
jgi:hypothetical protein